VRICSPSVLRLKYEWDHTVGLIINLRCGTAALNTSSLGASNTRVSTNSCSLFAMMFPVAILFPLFLNISQIVIQPFKALRPEPPVLRSPVGNVLERTCLEPAGPPLRFVSPRDQSRALQHLKVLGDGRHAHLEWLGQLCDRGFSGR